LPLLAGTRSRSEQVSCFSNLRQAGHAFHVWANDHGDRNPWWTSIREGGSYDAPGDPTPVGWTFADRNNVWFQWAYISNQLGTPKILVCPSDRVGAPRNMASNWSFGPDGIRTVQNNAVSYFIGLHSIYDSPRSILGGDRNIRFSTSNSGCSCHVALVQTLLEADHGIGWTNSIHGLEGNLLFTDGSVEATGNQEFSKTFFPIPDDNGSVHCIVPP